MESDQGKLFIGGISWETSEEKLKDHFDLYGEVLQAVVMKDKTSGRPRGFGFVVFADPTTIDRVLQDTHTIDGRTVDVKKAMSREEQQSSSRPANFNVGRGFGSGGNYKTKKIFVGGLPPTLTEEGFRQYFEAYGPVSDAVIMYDQQTQRPRGFGFIVFESEDTVERVVVKNFHDLLGKTVEVKRAMPKDANPGGGGGGGGGGRSMGSAGGGYQGGYGGSGGNSGSYDGRKSQDTVGGGYPSYGSGYNNVPASYGYGGADNYGGYGGYGGSNPGYGGGPAGATYGNHNATGAGYGSGPQGSWNGQAASGYGNTGSWGGQNTNMMGQSPGGVAAGGYGNQGYGGGYGGGFGGSDGSYGNQAGVGGYGVVGGRPTGVQSGNGSYMGGSYGDLSSGYGNQGWRSSDPSQNTGNYGADNGYGGGYGGAPAQQVQQQ